MLLDVKNLEVRYGGIRAVKGIDLDVAQGELVALIGANGAGKTSALKAICRLIPSTARKLEYAGADLSKAKVHELPQRGLVMVPEGRGIFGQLTVQENLAMGAYVRGSRDPEALYATFPRLRERRRQIAGTLSGGEQQMLAIARALMSEPKLLLLDEPSLGLAPAVVDQLYDALYRLHEEGLTLLLAEQSIPLALAIADYAYVLQTGRTVLEGTAESLEQNEQVQEIYLGIKATPASSG